MMIIDIDSDMVERSLENLIVLMGPSGAMAFLNIEIGPWLKKRARERFANEGDDVVGMWQQLSPATQAIRADSNYPVAPDHPINRRSGELENWVVEGGWFAYPTGLGASMEYPKNAPTGELKKKVQTAQIGRDEPRTHPRPVLGVNEADLLFLTTAYAFAVEVAIV